MNRGEKRRDEWDRERRGSDKIAEERRKREEKGAKREGGWRQEGKKRREGTEVEQVKDKF